MKRMLYNALLGKISYFPTWGLYLYIYIYIYSFISVWTQTNLFEVSEQLDWTKLD